MHMVAGDPVTDSALGPGAAPLLSSVLHAVLTLPDPDLGQEILALCLTLDYQRFISAAYPAGIQTLAPSAMEKGDANAVTSGEQRCP